MATSYGSPPPGTLNSQWRVGILTCVKGPTMNQEVGWRRQTKDKATKLCKAKPQGQKLLSNGTTQGSKFIFGFGSTCATRCKYLGALPKFQAQSSNCQAHCFKYLEHLPQKNSNTPKRATQVRVAIWAYSSSILNTTKTNTGIRIFHTRISLDINYSSRFVQYPHYPITCCLPRLSMVGHNCYGKSINLTAKRKTHGKQNNLTAQRKRLAAKRKTSRQKEKRLKEKEKDYGKISSMPRGHFNSYFFRHEVVVILFAVRFFFLP